MIEESKISYIKEQINEEELLKILNDVNFSEAELELDDVKVTEKDIRTIKKKVFKNIKINNRGKINIKYAIIAASIFGVVLLNLTMYNPNVWGKVKESLQFIPGIGFVEKDCPTQEQYMLTKKIEKQCGSGKVIIKGMVIDNKNVSVVIEGDKIPEFNKVVLQDNKGKKHILQKFSTGHFSNESKHVYWSIAYKYSGKISVGRKCNIILDTDLKIPVSLDKVSEITSFASLGPTTTIDDIGITAISCLEDDKLRINVLSPKSNSKEIVEYALNALPIDFKFDSEEKEKFYCNESQIYLKNSNGNKYMGFGTRNILLLGNEYYFKVGRNPDKEYTLTIPKVILQYNSNTEFTIDLPKVGDKALNKVVNVGGFPVNLSIKRVMDDKVNIYVDVNYNKDLPETLVSFTLNIPELPYENIYENIKMKSNMSSSPESYEINVSKDTTKLKLKFESPNIEKKGPWNIPIHLN